MEFNLMEFMNELEGVDLTQSIPRSEYQERVERVRQALKERELDVGIAFGNELFSGDTGWLTAYDPQIEPTAVVIGQNKTLVLGGPEGEAYASETRMVGEFKNVLEFKIPEEDYPGYSFDKFSDILKESCGFEPSRIGLLTLPSIMPIEIYSLIEDNTDGDIYDASQILLNFRYNKSPMELKMMETAARLSSNAMKAMIACIKPGMRELEVAACADFVMKAMGADRLGISTIVCSGDRASNVIGRASNKVMNEGDMVVLGASARYDGLASCIGRTVVLGEISSDQSELLQHAVRAFKKGIKHIGCDKPANMVDRTVREVLDPLELSPLYSLVHGIGWTEAMEGKGAATQHSSWDFPSGTAFMVDLGIFGRTFNNLPAKEVGLRLEDPYIIDHDGNTRCLTDLPLFCEPGQTFN